MPTEEQSFDWDELLDCIADQRVIPVVGKELLNLRLDDEAVPLEGYIAQRLAQALGLSLDRLPTDFSLNDVALQHLQRGGDARKIYSKIKRILDERPLPVPESLEKLAAITDFKLYVSLTFDSLLEEAINRIRFAGEPRARSLAYSTLESIQDLPSEIKGLDVPHVYHLFGVSGTVEDFAVTDEDNLELLHLLQSESRRPRLLFDEFRENHLLFVGCGYENWLERFVIRCITNERLTDSRRTAKFVADDKVRSLSGLTFFLKQYRTEVFVSGNAAQFVDKLHELWTEQHPASMPIEVARAPAPTMESGAVFLSYASEDRPAVRNMKEGLEKAGLAVWFDQGDLQAGDAWDRQIQRNIRTCALFIPFLSRQSKERAEGYFRKEWRWAIDRDQGMDESLRFIQPVVLDDIPDGANGIPPYFWTRHCSRFADGRPTPEFVEQLRNLVRASWLRQRGLR